ncbi:unnamed protein product, partial [Staurois parvus]
MTADLWGGRGSGYLNLTGTRPHFRAVVLPLVWPFTKCSATRPCALGTWLSSREP